MTRPVGRSIHDRRFSPLRLRIRHTVDADSPVRAPRYTGPRRVLRRSRHTRSSSLASVRRGQRRGREDRSTRPASPSASQRCHHLATVPRDRPIWRATWAWGMPASRRWTINRRPSRGETCVSVRH